MYVLALQDKHFRNEEVNTLRGGDLEYRLNWKGEDKQVKVLDWCEMLTSKISDGCQKNQFKNFICGSGAQWKNSDYHFCLWTPEWLK